MEEAGTTAFSDVVCACGQRGCLYHGWAFEVLMAADLGDGAVSLGNVLVFSEWYDDHARNMQLMEAGFATGQCNNAVLGLAMEQSLDEVLDIITYKCCNQCL